MIGLPAGTRIWIATGVTDMRSGFNGLAAKVQTALAEDPFSGHVFVFRGRRGDILKILWWSGDGLCLLSKRLERGHFIWPQASSGTISLSQAQLSMLRKALIGDARNAPSVHSRSCKHPGICVNSMACQRTPTSLMI